MILNLEDNSVAAGCVALAAAGVGSHLFYFMHGDHNPYAHRWITRGLTGIALLGCTVLYLTRFQALPTAIITSLFSVSYFTGLFTSISLYRLFFHSLGKFPGPFWARLSNLCHAYVIRDSDNYFYIQRLHEKYGPIVRTGPSNLSVNDPSAIRLVLGNSSKCTKSPWYSRSLPVVNLHTVRDKTAHDARRKVFSKAFTPAALNDYEKRVLVHCEEFVRQMEYRAGTPFDASDWLKYFAFDVMGDVGLGKEFHMMTSETNRWIPPLLDAGMADVGPTTPVPWLGSILMRLPGSGHHSKAWLEFVGSQVKERVEKHVERADVLTHLIDAYSRTEKKEIDFQWLRGDTRLTIVGGSDTTASTLTFLFCHLAMDPSQVKKLRAELEPLLNGKNYLEQKDISKAQHLDGMIQEALRLHPAIPSGFPRVTPPEGITIGDTFIPGGTTVVLPVYTIQRDAANYVRPDEFIPERWYSQPELIKNKEAFFAWNIGTNGCIGRALAVTEMRNLITHWIQNFESVRFAPGEDGSQILNETVDHFTVGVKPLKLVFEKK
ncbi:related to pisatin demethylase cytochrome P450 [Cephalotrichum gorgonifer]|uniref:Related to pisatin demethylase cytochrome P450 n=1 Tax=Cephalotrichum gorgonifer TaxID=2041049 RepID=A0AAE8N829_9PEZI|nr:related to pisatin demethylase cytochrome P450 [Cephalotrichum gorgonifer]